jgi:hypothetical protein
MTERQRHLVDLSCTGVQRMGMFVDETRTDVPLELLCGGEHHHAYISRGMWGESMVRRRCTVTLIHQK